MALRVVKQLEKVIGHRIFKVNLQMMKRMDKKFRSKKLRNWRRKRDKLMDMEEFLEWVVSNLRMFKEI